MPSCTIFTALWGEAYVRLFLSLNVRTLLAPKNLPIFVQKIGARYLIITTSDDRKLLEAAPLFKRLSALLPVSFFDLPKSDLTNVDRKNAAWAMATAHVQERNEYAIQMPPDVAWSDGAFDHLAELIMAGKKAIFLNWHVRAMAETFVPAFEQLFASEDDFISVQPRDLVRLTMQFPHPMNGAHMRHSNSFVDWPEHVFWPVRGQGLLMHVLALTPFVFDTAVCRLNNMRLLEGDYDSDQLAFVTDSDDVFMVSLADQGKDRHFYARSEKLEISRIAWWWLRVHTPAADKLVVAPFRIKFSHHDDMAWRRQEASARKFLRQLFYARDMYRIWQVCRELPGLRRASAVIAQVLSLGLAGALSRQPGRVAIFLPSDAALEPYWETTINAILAGPKKGILDLVRAHVVELPGADKFRLNLAEQAGEPTGEVIQTLDGRRHKVLRYTVSGIECARTKEGPLSVGQHVIYVIDKVLGDRRAAHE
jgi:hypothetical protein